MAIEWQHLPDRDPWDIDVPRSTLLLVIGAGFLTLLLGLLLSATACGLSLLALDLDLSEHPDSFKVLGLVIMLGQLSILPLALGIIYASYPGGRLLQKLGIRRLRWMDLGAILLTLAVMLPLEELVTRLWKPLLDFAKIRHAESQDIAGMLEGANWLVLAGMILVVVILVPIMEEIVIRRCLYGLLKPLIRRVPAMLVTSLIFSLIHFFILGIPALFVMGLGFQIVYVMRRNLLTSIILHCLVNLLATIALFCGWD